MFCPKCGQALDDNVKFCGRCGTCIQQSQSFEEKKQEGELYDELFAPQPQKKGSKKKLIIALAALAVLLAAALFAGYMIFFRKPEFAVYVKNGDLYYSDATPNSFKVANDIGDRTVYMTANGKHLIYTVTKDEEDILYITDVTNEASSPEKIKKGVGSVQLTADSKYIVFKSNGSLYYYDIAEKETVKLKAEVRSYVLSVEGSRIVYTTDDGEDYVNLYMEELGSNNQEKVGSGISYYTVNARGDILYYKKNNNLYKRETGKEKVLVDSDIETLYTPYTDGSIYYTKENKNDDSESDLYYYNGTDCKCIRKSIDYSGSVVVTGENYFILSYSDKAVFFVANGNVKKMDKNCSAKALNDDTTKLAYIICEDEDDSEGTLYVVNIESDGFGTPEKVATNVSDVAVTFTDSDKLIYMRDYDEEDDIGTLYCGDDLIENDVEEFVWIEDSKSVIYVTDQDEKHDTATLNIYKSGKSTRVADDVANIRFDAKGNIYYLTNYSKSSKEGTLYYFDGNESEKIDDDVSTLCHVLIPGSYYYKAYYNLYY